MTIAPDESSHEVLTGISEDRRLAQLVAEIENLKKAMSTRAPIEQAKGIIMATLHCGPDAAFAVLVAQSQTENRKLAEIAAEIAAAQDWHPSPDRAAGQHRSVK